MHIDIPVTEDTVSLMASIKILYIQTPLHIDAICLDSVWERILSFYSQKKIVHFFGIIFYSFLYSKTPLLGL